MIIYILLCIASIYCGLNASYTIQDWLALAGTLILGGIFIFTTLDFIFKEREDRRKHSEDLVKEAFEHHATNGYVNYEGDKISSIFVNWVESVYVSQHLKHKKYKELCHAYEYAKDYANRRIPHIENKLQQYKESVTKMLREAQIQIPESERFIDNKTEHYNISFVRHLIFDDIQRLLKCRDRGNKLKILGSELIWGSVVAVGDEPSLEYLKNVIYKIEADKTIEDIVRCIEAERLLLDNNIWLKRFNDEREEIVKYVIKKRRPLEGKCDMCPD